MGREEIEQVEKELDAVLDLVQRPSNEEQEPESGQETKTDPTGQKEADGKKRPARRESAVSREPEELPKGIETVPLTQNQKSGLKILRPADGLIAAFFIPIVIMVIVFAQRGIFPFGEECFLRTDMYHQYAPFFSEFQYKLANKGSLLYSWDIGMGVNFSALYAYYLASPVNWLLLLCPKSYVIEFMTILILIKTGLCGLSFTWYLHRHTGVKKFGACFFGIFYALSGYMAAYNWNIMWLDCIWLFPMILLGLELLVREKRVLLYCVTLGLSILSNYYISIMICIFMVIYLLMLLILYPPKDSLSLFGTLCRFGIYSLAAGGLAAVVLLPEIFALRATASGNIDFPNTVTSYFSIFDMIARHIGNVETEIGLDHWPNIYCGVAVLLMLLLYLGTKQIRAKEKAVYFGLLLFFYASFSVNVLNFIWHGFHYPNSLPCRQSFIYISLVLLMCYKAYLLFETSSAKEIAWSFWGACAFVILAEKLVDNKEQFHFSVFYVALILLAIYMGLICWYKKAERQLDLVALIAVLVVSVEAAANLAVTSVPTTSRTAYVKDNKDIEMLAKAARSDAESTGIFYRILRENRKTKNDGAWLHYPSVSLFSSVANASVSDFYRILGCESSTNAYCIKGSTPFVDSLFSIRYGIYNDQRPSTGLQEQIGRKGEQWMYKNKYTLPPAFVLPSDLEGNWIRDSGNPASVQNDISALLGVSPMLVLNESVNEAGKLNFTAEDAGEYYVYISNKKVEEVSAQIGEKSLKFDNVDRGFFLELGYMTKGQEVSLQSEGDGKPALQGEVYRFDTEAFIQVYEALSAGAFRVTDWEDTELSGSVTLSEPGTLFTSIPYEKGWSVWVDGEKKDTRDIFDTFVSVDLPEGTHTVEFTYEPEGLKAGAVITAASLLFVIGTAVFYRKNRSGK